MTTINQDVELRCSVLRKKLSSLPGCFFDVVRTKVSKGNVSFNQNVIELLGKTKRKLKKEEDGPERRNQEEVERVLR